MSSVTLKSKFEPLLEKSTPFFAWDLDVLNERINVVIDAFSCIPNFRLYYAMKANSSPIILRNLVDKKISIDVCSVNELTIALNTGFSASMISACPFVPSDDELEVFAQSGCSIDLDSIDDIYAWASIDGSRETIGLRINPDVKAGFHRHCASGVWSAKFGIPIKDLNNAICVATEKKLKIEGLHIHIGSSSYDPAPYLKAISKILKASNQLKQSLRYINIGGGWGIPFSAQNEERAEEYFPLVRYANSIAKLLKYYDISKEIEIRAEPGEYLVGPCGFLVCKVRRIINRTKANKGHKIVVLDGGSYLYPGPSLYDSDNFVTVLNRDAEKNELQILAGRSMLAGDIFGPERLMPSLETNDIVAIGIAGAYSQIKSTQFNLLPSAQEFSL